MFCQHSVVLFGLALFFEATVGSPLEIVQRLDEETERIINGENATQGAHPYAAAFYQRNSFICTSTIMSKTRILTAAHCVEGGSRFSVRVGDIDRRRGRRVNINRCTMHPQYDFPDNDIAVCTTVGEIPFNANTGPVSFPSPETDARLSKFAKSLGWGKIKEGPNGTPDILQVTNQTIVKNTDCTSAYGFQIDNSKICATGTKGDSGICNGDSGGPLINTDRGTHIQRGIHSFVSSRGCVSSPGVSTRVSEYLQFMKENAGSDPINIL